MVDLFRNVAKIVEASECVAEIGGNDAYWIFSDNVFTNGRGSNDATQIDRLDDFATMSGVDIQLFENCLSSGKYSDYVTKSIQEAKELGFKGTPTTRIIVGKTGEEEIINGAQPYSVVQQVIEKALSQ